jgi:hypothetical protein
MFQDHVATQVEFQGKPVHLSMLQLQEQIVEMFLTEEPVGVREPLLR